MKTLLVTLLLASSAYADEIIPSGSCNAYCTCQSVETDTGRLIDYISSPNYAAITLGMDGVTYTADEVQLADVTYRKWTTRVVSGRGAGRSTQHCAIVSGSVVMP